MQQKQRIRYFDIAKGFGMLCMIAGHMGITRLYHLVFPFHMPLFFLISGYFISFKEPFDQYRRRKLGQLLPPYLFTCACVCVFSVVVNVLMGEPEAVLPDFGRWLYASFYGAGSNHQSPFRIWQIGAVWFLLALFWALLIVRYFARKPYAPLWILAMAYLGYETSQYLWLPWSVQAGCTAALFVYAGTLMREHRVFERKVNPWLLVLAGAVYVFEVKYALMLSIVRNHYSNGLFNILAAVLISYALIIGCKGIDARCNGLSKLLVFYGSHSLLILCFHLIELNLFPWAVVRTWLAEQGFHRWVIHGIVLIARTLWCTVMTLLALKCPWICRIFGERSPKKA